MANSPFPVLRKEVQNYFRSCEYLLKTPTPTSPSLSQTEREIVAAEALLKIIGDLTDAEMEAVQEMLNRLSEKLLDSGSKASRNQREDSRRQRDGHGGVKS